jgi:hypothetical protein
LKHWRLFYFSRPEGGENSVTKLLKLSDVQKLIGVPAKRLRLMVQAGSFPALRIRTRIFVEPEQLTEFLRLCRVNSAEDAARRTEGGK